MVVPLQIAAVTGFVVTVTAGLGDPSLFKVD
jgi:hypothetical protein